MLLMAEEADFKCLTKEKNKVNSLMIPNIYLNTIFFMLK